MEEHQLHLDETQTVETAHVLHNVHKMRTAERLLLVSDGSYEPQTKQAGYAWICTTEDRTAHIKFSTPIQSNRYMTPYRAEVAGLADAIAYLLQNEWHRVPIDIYCDCSEAVSALGETSCSPSDMSRAEMDLIRASRLNLNEYSEFTLNHIYGHQDDGIPYKDLPLPVQLNTECDSEAKRAMKRRPLHTTAQPTKGGGALLIIGNDIVTTKMDSQIHWASQRQAMKEYAMEKLMISSDQYDAINWTSLGAVKKRFKIQRSVRVSKILYGWLNIGHQKAKMGGDATCPCCGEKRETQPHLYSCMHPRMTEAYQEGMDEI